MKRWVVSLAVIAVLLFYLPAQAQDGSAGEQPALVLTNEQGEYPLGLHLSILEDPSGSLTIQDVTSPAYASRFIPSQEAVPNFGYTESTFWLRLRLKNLSSQTAHWLLETEFPNLNYVDLYLPGENGAFTVRESGALRSSSLRQYPYHHIIFELPLAYQAEQAFYIRVASGSSVTLGFTLWSPEAFAFHALSQTLRIGLFYGALLALLIYQLYAFFTLREAAYFYLILFLTSAILFFSAYEGLADQYLGAAFARYRHAYSAILFALFFGSALKFSDVLLEQKQRAPRLHLFANILLVVWAVLGVIAPFGEYGKFVLPGAILLVVTPATCAVFGVYHLVHGYHPARLYLLSWLGLLVGVVITGLVRIDWLPSIPLTESAYRIGLIWLGLAWSMALADRINRFKMETETAVRNLQLSENRLSQILEGLPLGVVVYGPDARPTYVNQRAGEILSNPVRGIRPDLLARRTFAEAIDYFSFRTTGSEQLTPLEDTPVWQAFQGRSAAADNIEADLIDRRVPLETWANPVKDEHGAVEAVVVAFQDIAQRKALNDELEKSRLDLEQRVALRTEQLSVVNQRLAAENTERRRLEDLLRLRLEWLVVVNQANQAVGSLNDLPEVYQSFAAMIYRLFSAAGAFLAEAAAPNWEIKLLAYAGQGMKDGNLSGLVCNLAEPELSEQLFRRAQPVELPGSSLVTMDGPLGAHFQSAGVQALVLVPLHCQTSLVGLIGLEFLQAGKLFSADEVMLIETICLDILQVREKAYQADQTQALIAAEERNRLARDLHDSVTQVLFSSSLLAEVLPQIWQRDPQTGMASLEELRRLNRGALAEMRTMLLELRPAALSKTPLGDLLAQLTEAVTSRSGLDFQLAIEQVVLLPEDVHVAFYRVAQESLNNVVKHARASLVSVSLNTAAAGQAIADNRLVQLIVRDNGCGFNVETAGAYSLGIGIMRERAAAIRAVLEIQSQPGQGAAIKLTWQG